MRARLDVCLDASRPPRDVPLSGPFEGLVARLRPITPAIEESAAELANKGGSGPLTVFAQQCWAGMQHGAFLLAINELQDRRRQAEAQLEKLQAAAAKAKKKRKARLRKEAEDAEVLLTGISNAIDRAEAEEDTDIVHEGHISRTLYRLKANDLEAWAACHEYQRYQERATLAQLSICLLGLFEIGEGRVLTPLASFATCSFDDPESVSAHLRGIVDPGARTALIEQLQSKLYGISLVSTAGKEPSASPHGPAEATAEAGSTAASA